MAQTLEQAESPQPAAAPVRSHPVEEAQTPAPLDLAPVAWAQRMATPHHGLEAPVGAVLADQPVKPPAPDELGQSRKVRLGNGQSGDPLLLLLVLLGRVQEH